jgi:hypothetical protein
MKTTNDLLQHLADTMQRLKESKITVDAAKAQASLVKQSNNILRYELDLKKFEHKVKMDKR